MTPDADGKYRLDVLCGVCSLPVEIMHHDPKTNTLSFEEVYPGKTYATQADCDADFARKRAEQVAAMAEAQIMADFLSGANEPRPWWKLWA